MGTKLVVWLIKPFINADLNNYKGLQYTQPNNDIFGCFSNALPDRWGSTLLNRREQSLVLSTKETPVHSPNLHIFRKQININDTFACNSTKRL